MKPTAFDRLPQTTDGRPVVVLMSNPDLTQDGFLSLVDKGANERTIQVVKRSDVAPEGTPDPIPARKLGELGELPSSAVAAPVLLDLGQTTGAAGSWFSRLFGAMIGGGGQVAKSDAVDFNAAVVVPKVFDRLYEGTDALLTAVATILHDTEVGDKRAMVEVALAQFSRYVLDAFQIPALKAEQLQDVREVTAKTWTEIRAVRSAQVIGTAEAVTIEAARKALQDAGAALETLATKAATPAAPAPTPAPEATEEPMNLQSMHAVALAASAAAVKATKAANPTATTDELEAAGAIAAAEVFKSAVAGPAQPGIPTNALATQHAQSGGSAGTASDPMGQIMKAINQLTSLTSKIDKTLHGDLGADGQLVEGGDPGVLAVVAKQGELLSGLAQKAAKADSTPRPPNSNGGGEADPEIARKAAEAARKAAETDVWGGSALSFAP